MDFQYWKLPLGRECRFLKPAKKKKNLKKKKKKKTKKKKKKRKLENTLK